MPGRLPTKSDFPPALTLSITPPPASQPPTNILLLLHGLGDTHTPFQTLSAQLSLPETACVALQAPHPLPFDLAGYHWGDDIVLDQSSGAIDSDAGFKGATLILSSVINDVLREKCGYAPREIMLFGYAQGGMVALQAAAEREDELGGVVSIAGALSGSVEVGARARGRKRGTPVLVCRAERGSGVTEGQVERLRGVFEVVEDRVWKRRGDGMMRSREEMLPIMQFFARRLRSVRGVPEGSVQLT